MNYRQLHSQAKKNWNNSRDIRRRYPTFIFYWREQYERVYKTPGRTKVLTRLFKGHR